MRSKRSLLLVAATVAVIALVVALAITLGPGGGSPSAITPSWSPSQSTVATTSGSTATPTSSPSAPSTAGRTVAGVTLYETLPASGDWALVVRRSFDSAPIGERRLPATDTLHAVSISGSAASRTIRLLSFTSAIDQPSISVDNLVRAQLSPDGHRLVLSIVAGGGADARAALVIVDLVAGTVTPFVTDPRYNDTTPAWRPNGEQIAFVRSTRGLTLVQNDASIWFIGSDGAGMRLVLGPTTTPPEGTGIFSWNGDGSGIGYSRGFELFPYYVLQRATGRSEAIGGIGRLPQGRAGSDWRSGSPAFVGVFAEGPHGGRSYLVDADGQLGGPARDLFVVSPEELNFVFSPRWRPGSDQILFASTTTEPTSVSRLWLTDANGTMLPPRELVRVDVFSLLASWTGDGQQILYLAASGVAGAVHLMNADGTGDRVIQMFGGVPQTRIEWPDLAVLGF
ncbi:MAG: hypothetical protein M3R54_10740 [Chloroflexota bacterium]|nr:hypothetical protein [Chloroflexota bacterium]